MIICLRVAGSPLRVTIALRWEMPPGGDVPVGDAPVGRNAPLYGECLSWCLGGGIDEL